MPQLKADMTYTDFFKARTELVKALADSAYPDQFGCASSSIVVLAGIAA